MTLHLPDGSVVEPERCNRCGAAAGSPISPPLEVPDSALNVHRIDNHGDVIDGRCAVCRAGHAVTIDLRRDLTPYQQLALFVLAGAWLDVDEDGDSDERVNVPVIDAVGDDVAQRLARGILALGISPGAMIHDQDCLTLTMHPGAGCTCRGGAQTLYELAGVDLALAAAEAAIASHVLPDNGTAGGV